MDERKDLDYTTEMNDKQVRHVSDIRDRIFAAVKTIADPIKQTLSPRGGNVLFHDVNGQVSVTNDGVTIAKNIQVKGQVESAVIDIIRHAALRTNAAAGDGTSTTVVLSSILIEEGFRLIENGWNCMDLKNEYDKFADAMVEQLGKLSKKAKNDKDLLYVATISSNNDTEIAENTVRTIKTAGEDGMVFIEPANRVETEIIEDSGFHVRAGMFAPELRNNDRTFAATYLDVPVLVTDKRLYYQQEAETILSVALKNGYKEVVIVAKDFIGEALPFFIANHTNEKSPIRVLLVKEPRAASDNGVTLEDLAIYLGGKVVSDKSGNIVDTLTIDDFVMARRVYSDAVKTIISRNEDEKNKDLEARISGLKKEIKKKGDLEDSEMDALKERLASLTTGMVTIRVGGRTGLETNERIYRYEDAVNATRAAMREGYVVGGGLGMFQAFRNCNFKGDLAKVYKKVGEANIRQIATNCGLSGDLVIDNILAMPRNQKDGLVIGFNAKTMNYDDLLEAGVVDPFKAEEMAIRNAVSVAGMIISSNYFVLNEEENEYGESTKKRN